MNDPDRWHTSDRFDDDAIFAEIVAHLNDDAAAAERAARPATEDLTTDRAASDRAASDGEAADSEEVDSEEGGAAADSEDADGKATNTQVVPTPQVWRAYEVDDEYEEHFEPSPVSPLPVGDLQFWGIIAGMGGGPLLLLYLVYFNRDANSYWILTAIAMSVGGFAMLVSRLPPHDENGDDGARL